MGIQQELENGMAADPEFMSAVLKRLTLHKAKARLKEIHQGLLAKHAQRIIAMQDPSMDIRKAMGWNVDEVRIIVSNCQSQATRVMNCGFECHLPGACFMTVPVGHAS